MTIVIALRELRLVDTGAHRAWLAAYAPRFRYSLALAGFALVLQVLLAAVIPNVWFRMGAAGFTLSALAVRSVDVDWRQLFRPSWRQVASGVVAAAVLYAAGWLVVAASLPLPGAATQIAQLFAWKNSVPAGLMLPLLLFIVAVEEIVWRCAVTLPFAARLGPWLGALAAGSAFALAHVPLGVPLLAFAALCAGTYWSLLVVKTRSAVPSFVCHILWDLAVLVWFPYRL
jgi:membrane protease YdiL (CAAX protease family)